MPDATAELTGASADIPLTSDAREILERAAEIASARGSRLTSPGDVLKATLQLPRSLAEREIQALGFDPKSIAAQIPPDGEAGASLPLRQLLVNANREAQVLGHYQVDSIHLLLAMLYSDSPATSAPLQKAGLTLYDLRRHLQSRPPGQASPDTALRRKPWPSLRGVFSVSPVFLGIVAATAASGVLLWTRLIPGLMTVWTIVFVVAGWITSLCIHEFGHAFVAYLGGDRSVAGAGYLTLNPLRYTNVTMSIILPVAFLLLGGIAMPGGAVYVNYSALRTRAWSSAVFAAGPLGTFLCGLLIAATFTVAGHERWITTGNIYFFAGLALLGFFMALGVVLNLLPVPGLDGFGIIRPWLPYSLQLSAMQFSTFAIYGVFLVLWFVAPVRDAFFQFVFQLTSLGNIPLQLIIAGQYLMRVI